MKKICVVTGTRAEYGLLRWVMDGISKSKTLDLQIVVTGMHLSPEFDLTYKAIENDGFKINKKIELLMSSDSPIGISKSIGLGLMSFPEAFKDLKPELILVLGDRFEILSAVISAMICRIPIGHISGGEATEGLIDESIRHSITKMSHLHFVAAEEYRSKVVQLGESPKRVFLVGGLGIDNILKLKLLNRNELEKSLNFRLGKNNLLVTFHPVTLENQTSEAQIKELLRALNKLKDTKIIFTMPNADTNGRIIFDLIKEYVKKNDNSKAFTSLGQLRYLSCVKHCDGVVGNSSSGISEIPSFKKGTINIGDRQKGRLKAKSIIDCSPNYKSISNALKKLYSNSFKEKLKVVESPFGNGGASKLIVQTLKRQNLNNILKKSFYIKE